MRGIRNINTHISHTLNLRVRLIIINILNPVISKSQKSTEFLAETVGWTSHRKDGKKQKKQTKQNNSIALIELKLSVPLHKHHTALIN